MEKIEPHICSLSGKKLIGKRITMSFASNKTAELWRSFMPVRNAIENIVGPDLYSVQTYPPLFFERFDVNTNFEKWAAMEVSNFDSIPAGMETFELAGGDYAVFVYKGAASQAESIFRYILGDWLPGSGYTLANRPHFEVLGEKYKKDDPDSEEEIWIPIN